MPSGRRHSVLIFCISPVKELYLSALDHYDPDAVFIFIPNGDDTVSQSAREIFRMQTNEIACRNVQELNIDASDFKNILGSLIRIKESMSKEYGDYLDIYLNISSGTHEFAAAAMFVSMLPKMCTAFRVELDTGFDKDKIIELVSSGDFLASEPEIVSTVQNKDPDSDMVEFLKVIKELRAHTKYPKSSAIIKCLKERDQWAYDPERKSGSGRTPLVKKEEMYLNRHFIRPALENGWLEKTTHDELVVSGKGEVMMEVYGCRLKSEARCFESIRACNVSNETPDDACYECIEQPRLSHSDKIDRLYECDRFDNFWEEGSENVISVESGDRTYRLRLSME